MVKLTTILIGLVIFSIFTTIMFGSVASILNSNPGPKTSAEWTALSGGYEQFGKDVSTQKNSTLRQIKGLTDQGPASSVDESIFFVKGAISGGRLSGNFFTNFEDVTNKVSGDTVTYINPKIFNAIEFVFSILIILIVLHFIRGFKTET